MAWESQDDGFIAKILLQDGAKDIPVGTAAMIFVEEEVCRLACLLTPLLNSRKIQSGCWAIKKNGASRCQGSPRL